MGKIIITFVVFIFIILISCEDNSLLPLPTQKYSSSFSGNVILENQTDYSNALVYVDSLNIGVSTDSSGNFTFIFNEKDSVYNGEFKVRYFLNDYDMDSAKIMIVKGKVKLDTLDIDSEGKIKTKELKQIVLVEGWTDKAEYRVGDKVTFTARVTNLSSRTIHIHIYSCGGTLSNFVALYNDKYAPFSLGGEQNVLTMDCDIYLQPGKYYEGTIRYEIFAYRPLIPDEYIVVTGFIIEDRLLNQFQSKFSKYVLEEWWKICRGKSPKYDTKPNKYNFPHIRIIN